MMNQAAKILVVDDEANIRFFLEETLSKDGYQVKAAENGEAALKLIVQEEFDLALIDLHMPGMGGDEFVSILHRRWPDTIVIILTAYATLDTAIEALRQGAHDYLFKPCKSAGIRESVRKGLIKRQQVSRQRALLARLEHELYEDLEAIHEAVHPLQTALQPSGEELESKETSFLNWKNLAVDLIDFIIRRAKFAGQVGIEIHQRIQAQAQHGLRFPRHIRDVIWRRDGLQPCQRQRPLGDVDPQIAHPFQVVIDLQHRDDKAQIDGYRLVEGEDLQAFLFDIHLELVDLHVLIDHLVSKGLVALTDGFDRQCNALFD
jgi:DNA-binding response OmpR family regulator